MLMFQYLTTTRVLKVLGPVLEHLAPIRDLEKQTEVEKGLWTGYLSLFFLLLHEDCLQLERFSSTKASALKARYGDLREEIFSMVEHYWPQLGALTLVPNVGKMLSMMTVSSCSNELQSQINHPQIKGTALNLYYLTLEKEFQSSGSIAKIETQTIDTLDRLITQKKVDVQLFQGVFTKKQDSLLGDTF